MNNVNKKIKCPFKGFEIGSYVDESVLDEPIRETKSISTKADDGMEQLIQRSIQSQLQKKIDIYNSAGLEYIVEKDTNGNLIEVMLLEEYNKKNSTINTSVAEEPANDEGIEIWHNKKISKDYTFPMPTYCLKDKKYDAKAFGALMVLSNGGTEIMHFDNDRFIYDNSFNTAQLAKDLGVGRTTLERNIKKLKDVECNVFAIENTKNGIVYRLNYGQQSKVNENEVNKYVSINQKMLKELVCVFNNNAIKLYCLMNYMCNTQDYTILTEHWLCEQIGLTGKSESNQTKVRTILKALEKCGYIKSKKHQVFKWDNERNKKVPNVSKAYKLCTFEEWEQLDNKVK